MNSKIIAVDFDGTLCENKYPKIGEAKQDVITYLKNRKKSGVKLILWTCRMGDDLKKAVDWCTDHGLIFDAINENITKFKYDSRKVYADEYLDDRNITIDDIIG